MPGAEDCTEHRGHHVVEIEDLPASQERGDTKVEFDKCRRVLGVQAYRFRYLELPGTLAGAQPHCGLARDKPLIHRPPANSLSRSSNLTTPQVSSMQ